MWEQLGRLEQLRARLAVLRPLNEEIRASIRDSPGVLEPAEWMLSLTGPAEQSDADEERALVAAQAGTMPS